ncbi:hypothetical protein [Actinoplanes sp. TFC3]|uniref:DUF6197 family protein n=1 Tax=Actinoplanes sp. TFC3 TaxID=1710355 RepID=UPI00082FF2F8|nr:hypothetical protein [Actinoplanes sp. TFC3]
MKATQQPTTTTDLDPDMTPGVLLRSAAIYLQRYGWIRNDFFDLTNEVNFPPACALGAINVCAHGRPILGSDDTADDDNTDTAIRGVRVFAAYLDPEYDSADTVTWKASAFDVVSQWNDEQDRTIKDVTAALNDAADEWDSTHHTRGAR